MQPLPPLSSVPLVSPLSNPATSTGVDSAAGGGSFKDLLLDSLREVNSAQQHADKAVESLLTGGDVSQAEVLTAVQKADLAFRTMMQIRNKLVEAYHQVENIRV